MTIGAAEDAAGAAVDAGARERAAIVAVGAAQAAVRAAVVAVEAAEAASLASPAS